MALGAVIACVLRQKITRHSVPAGCLGRAADREGAGRGNGSAPRAESAGARDGRCGRRGGYLPILARARCRSWARRKRRRDRKSTRLNSSHVAISYAVFCLKKKKKHQIKRRKNK